MKQSKKKSVARSLSKSRVRVQTPEYKAYLKRLAKYGDEHPRLSPAEFDKLDDEYLDLLDQGTEFGMLSDEASIRKQELEFLLLENEK